MSKQEQISKAQVEVLNRLKAQVSTALAHPSVRTDVDLSGLLIMDQENYLAKLYSGENEGGAKGGQSLDSFDKKAEAKGDGAISPNVAQSIVTALKALPREAADKFLAKFGVQRIKDLPASQVEKARAFVEQLQTELAAPAASETEVDPFA